MNWDSLRKLCEQNMAYCDFVAKCVYAYLAEHDDGSPEDRKFINELIRFLDGDSK